MSRRRSGGLEKGHSGRLLTLEPAPRGACCGIDKQARSPRRLLEQPTEPCTVSTQFDGLRPSRSTIGQMLWNRPALSAQFPASPIEQHEIMIEGWQELLVGRPHVQTPSP